MGFACSRFVAVTGRISASSLGIVLRTKAGRPAQAEPVDAARCEGRTLAQWTKRPNLIYL